MRQATNIVVAPTAEVMTPALPILDFSDIEEAEIIEEDAVETSEEQRPHFIEGNSIPISFGNLRRGCIVPTFANNELTISHTDFILAVQAAAKDVFIGQKVSNPEIRVSHAINGRVPTALHKAPSQLLDSEKTLYYQRMAFCMEIPIRGSISDNEATVTVGGVRALNNENLGSRPTAQKFKAFIGWRVNVCTNLCVFGDAMIDKLEVMSAVEIYQRAAELFQGFDPELNRLRLESLGRTYMDTETFCHIIGRLRLYEALPAAQRNQLGLPQIILGDQAINAATKNFVSNPNFGLGDRDKISCWDFMNLLTESNKSAYVDRFLAREVNATDVSFGIQKALNEEQTPYQWFLR